MATVIRLSRQGRRNRPHYRVGVFDGYDSSGGSKNPDADLRYTGYVSLNLIGESQTGWFFDTF